MNKILLRYLFFFFFGILTGIIVYHYKVWPISKLKTIKKHIKIEQLKNKREIDLNEIQYFNSSTFSVKVVMLFSKIYISPFISILFSIIFILFYFPTFSF